MGLAKRLTQLTGAREQVIAPLGPETAGQRHSRNGHLAQAVGVGASAALEVHVVVEVGLSGAFDGAGSVAQHVRVVDDAVNETALLEAFEGTIQSDAVGARAHFLLNFGPGEGVAFAGEGPSTARRTGV